MNQLIEKHEIKEILFERYFKENAENKFGIDLLKFMWFREGQFLNPQKKQFYLDEFIKQEIEKFYVKKELNIPFLEICLTTKCTLKCKDCCALIPEFNNFGHMELSFEKFKAQLDKLCDNVDRIRHLVLLGGEPLMNPNLPEMLEYACQKNNIDIIRITTNGTMLPSKKLLEVFEKNNDRAYFFISNYGVNENLGFILKYEQLKTVLQENKIKFQMVDNWNWLCELGFAKEKFDQQVTKEKFKTCYRKKCTQVFDGKIDICSKALAAKELGILPITDYIDLEKTQDLKQDFIDFYKKDYQQACEYCIISDEEVTPALQ